LLAERPASERHEWQIPLSQGEVDRCGLGVIDERAKRFSVTERRIAEHLADPGPAVVSVSEGFGIYGRTADARVNGIAVEFKSLVLDSYQRPETDHFPPHGQPLT
jgi:hypothetical protein